MNVEEIKTSVWQNPLFFTAFGFGTGLSKFAPGTVGTFAALPIYALIYGLNPMFYAFACVVFFALGVPLCHKVSSNIGIDDYKGIVWDEVVGYLVTMFLVPTTIATLVVGFLLFRIFDILKPYPINYVEKKVKGGLGIMLDDVLAAIPACLILHALVGMGLL